MRQCGWCRVWWLTELRDAEPYVSESRRRFRGVAAKLSVALFGVNLVALTIVYSGTVPSLGKRLVAAREAALLRDAKFQRRIYQGALSRLDAGRMPLAPEPVRLDRVAASVVRELSAAAKTQRHRLELRARGDIVVLGDRGHITRIVRVLVENALRHTPPGTAISVNVSGAADSGRISVEDAGPGIPAAHLDRIFERFYRLEGAVASGSGLGLSLAQQLAALMAARIDVDSSPGRTTFSLVLPLHDSADESRRERHALA